MTGIWVLGGYQSDFARNLQREGVDFAGRTAEVVDHTLDQAGRGGTGIGVIDVANAACASGSVEVHGRFTPSECLAIDEIGGGYPVGASGVRLLVDATKQVSGGAAQRQVRR